MLTLHKVRTLLRVYYYMMLEYRSELILWMLSGSLPFILMGVWMEAARSGKLEQTPEDFVRYFLCVFVTRQLTVVWVIWEFEGQVVEGKLSPQLLQPLDPGWRHFFSHVAERGARLPFMLFPVGICLALYPAAAWVPSARELLFYVGLCSLAFVLRFVTQYCFAMITFWTERAGAIENTWFLLYLFGSGIMAPLELYPEEVRTVLAYTPFPYVVYLPSQVLAGGDAEVLKGLGVMLLWTLFFWGTGRLLWRRGLQRYSGQGA